jgi:hypothetical protein
MSGKAIIGASPESSADKAIAAAALYAALVAQGWLDSDRGPVGPYDQVLTAVVGDKVTPCHIPAWYDERCVVQWPRASILLSDRMTQVNPAATIGICATLAAVGDEASEPLPAGELSRFPDGLVRLVGGVAPDGSARAKLFLLQPPPGGDVASMPPYATYVRKPGGKPISAWGAVLAWSERELPGAAAELDRRLRR